MYLINAMLIKRWHREIGKQHREDEDVIHAQRVFDDVAGGKLQCLLRSGVIPDANVKEDGEGDPRDRPPDGFAKRDDVGLPVEDAEVEGEHQEDENVEADPEPEVVSH